MQRYDYLLSDVPTTEIIGSTKSQLKMRVVILV